jgi:DhnA family fructose-bisphosphate aldolase class Ia
MNSAYPKARRMNRLFGRDGRIFIVVMDQPAQFGAMPGVDQPGQLVRSLVAGGADAIVATFGVAITCAADFGRAGLILRADGGSTKLAPSSLPGRPLYSPEDALRLGADGLACIGYPGSRWEDPSLREMAALAAQCHKWQTPLMAEMLPLLFENPKEGITPENIRDAVRIGAELGADIIKTQYTGSVESFQYVVDGCYVPVVILGGPRMGSDLDLLTTVSEALAAGASGVALGRNVWQHPQPERITAALAAVVHLDATVEQALGMLE